MSVNLIAGLIGVGGLILFAIWIIRRNVKHGRMEGDIERQVEYSEAIGDINDMEKALDEKTPENFTTLDGADDWIDQLPDESSDR